jgi:hypothetical protein
MPGSFFPVRTGAFASPLIKILYRKFYQRSIAQRWLYKAAFRYTIIEICCMIHRCALKFAVYKLKKRTESLEPPLTGLPYTKQADYE